MQLVLYENCTQVMRLCFKNNFRNSQRNRTQLFWQWRWLLAGSSMYCCVGGWMSCGRRLCCPKQMVSVLLFITIAQQTSSTIYLSQPTLQFFSFPLKITPCDTKMKSKSILPSNPADSCPRNSRQKRACVHIFSLCQECTYILIYPLGAYNFEVSTTCGLLKICVTLIILLPFVSLL